MNRIAARVTALIGLAVALSAVAGQRAAAGAAPGELVQSNFHATDGRYHEIAADFSKDRRFLLTGSPDRAARLWDVASGRKLRQFGPQPGPVISVALAPGGRFIATGSDGVTQPIRIWDIKPGRALREFERHKASGLVFLGARDGKAVGHVAQDRLVRIQ
jgi:WD40 repeat protein